ncbi:MAG TPA: PepSY domain-containing protein [Anaerolineales bacterium]|nr:PepSY domain-containing protein [Anaerolineales bacterium]
MLKKTLLIPAVAVTAFALVAGGSLAMRQASSNLTNTPAVAASAVPNDTSALQSEAQKLEAQYQAALATATQNNLVSEVQAQNTTPPQPTATSQFAISEAKARELAQQAVPNAEITRIELVNFQGTVAWEVSFATGKLYLSADSGEVLYDGASSQAQLGNAGTGGGFHPEGDDDSDDFGEHHGHHRGHEGGFNPFESHDEHDD